jgi:ribosomal protein L3 glutamine methyltransferase
VECVGEAELERCPIKRGGLLDQRNVLNAAGLTRGIIVGDKFSVRPITSCGGINGDALEVAARNVIDDYALEHRISLHQGDLFEPLGDRKYDLIISNPPYVDAEGMTGLPRECRAEPEIAFDGGPDGLDIVRRISKEAGNHLTPSGGLLCEIGRGRELLEDAFPHLPLLWLDTEESEGEVFWIAARDL